MRIAVLDDYQRAAASLADWSALPAQIRFLHEHLDADALVAQIGDCDGVVLMRERTAFPRALIDRLPKLRLIVTAGARNTAIDVEAATDRGVQVCGTETLGHPTAELTWGLILALARHIPYEADRLRGGHWQSTLGRSLKGLTLGIFGLGRLGGRVARVARAFEMEVLAWSPRLTPERAAEHGATWADKSDLLGRSDFVTLHMPYGPHTRDFIGADELALMKPDACLINTSRSPIVNEAALLDALTGKRIGGAAIDVFPVEPLPPGYPLIGLASVVATPHLGYVTEDNLKLIYGQAAEAIAAFTSGRPVPRPINKIP